jgi:hypothetical protein
MYKHSNDISATGFYKLSSETPAPFNGFVILPLRDGYPMSANKKHRWSASLRIDAARASPTTTTPPASEMRVTSLYCGRRFHRRRGRRRDCGHVEDLEESIMLVSLSLSSA